MNGKKKKEIIEVLKEGLMLAFTIIVFQFVFLGMVSVGIVEYIALPIIIGSALVYSRFSKKNMENSIKNGVK